MNQREAQHTVLVQPTLTVTDKVTFALSVSETLVNRNRVKPNVFGEFETAARDDKLNEDKGSFVNVSKNILR